LGQGNVILTRITPGSQVPGMTWVASDPVSALETLRAAVSGASEYADGVTVLATDLRIVAAVPALNWAMGGDDGGILSLSIDGKPVTIIRVRGLPAAGTATAIEIIARN